MQATIAELLTSRVEIHLSWLVFALYLAYELGYFCGKRKYGRMQRTDRSYLSKSIVAYVGNGGVDYEGLGREKEQE